MPGSLVLGHGLKSLQVIVREICCQHDEAYLTEVVKDFLVDCSTRETERERTIRIYVTSDSFNDFDG